jgi:hypothetical protein
MAVLIIRLHGMLTRPLHSAQEIIISGVFGAAIARLAFGYPVLTQRFFVGAVAVGIVPLWVSTRIIGSKQVKQRLELAKLFAIAFFGTIASFILGILVLTGDPRLAVGFGNLLGGLAAWPVFAVLRAIFHRPKEP